MEKIMMKLDGYPTIEELESFFASVEKRKEKININESNHDSSNEDNLSKKG